MAQQLNHMLDMWKAQISFQALHDPLLKKEEGREERWEKKRRKQKRRGEKEKGEEVREEKRGKEEWKGKGWEGLPHLLAFPQDQWVGSKTRDCA